MNNSCLLTSTRKKSCKLFDKAVDGLTCQRMPFPRLSWVDDFKLSTLYVCQMIATRPVTFNCDIMYGLKITKAYCLNMATAAPSKVTALFSDSVSKQVSSSDFAENRIFQSRTKMAGRPGFHA